MDWSKAKTYLIVAFLILDILLGWQYWGVRSQESNYVQTYAEQLKDVQAALAVHHIKLEVDIPRKTPDLAFLRVRFDQTNPADVVKQAVDDIKQDTPVMRGVPIVTDSASFLYQQPGIYQEQFLHSLIVNLGDSKGVDHLFELLSPHVWRASEYAPDVPAANADKSQVRYLQMYKEYPLFSSPLIVQLKGDAVVSYTQYCLEVEGEEGTRRTVIPALNALNSFVDSLSPGTLANSEMKILSIQLGYYSKRFNVGDTEWYLAPMWRILTDKGSYYVNGITGEVQGEERE